MLVQALAAARKCGIVKRHGANGSDVRSYDVNEGIGLSTAISHGMA